LAPEQQPLLGRHLLNRDVLDGEPGAGIKSLLMNI
jgi:hypothetical protein